MTRQQAHLLRELRSLLLFVICPLTVSYLLLRRSWRFT